jgi:hypothetical protein
MDRPDLNHSLIVVQRNYVCFEPNSIALSLEHSQLQDPESIASQELLDCFFEVAAQRFLAYKMKGQIGRQHLARLNS